MPYHEDLVFQVNVANVEGAYFTAADAGFKEKPESSIVRRQGSADDSSCIIG
jgi:hypothetical protein